MHVCAVFLTLHQYECSVTVSCIEGSTRRCAHSAYIISTIISSHIVCCDSTGDSSKGGGLGYVDTAILYHYTCVVKPGDVG